MRTKLGLGWVGQLPRRSRDEIGPGDQIGGEGARRKTEEGELLLGRFHLRVKNAEEWFWCIVYVQCNTYIHYFKNRKKITKDPEASKVFLLQLASLKQALTQSLL